MAALVSTTLIFRSSLRALSGCQVNRSLLLQKLSTDAPPSQNGPSPGENGGKGAAPPPHVNPDDADEELREKIFRASLMFVSKHGWTQKTLSSGADSLGLPSVAHGMFPKGGVELVNFFYRDCNAQLSKQLAQKVEENRELEDSTKPSTRTFIREAAQARLQMLIPYIEKWPQAMAIQALPQNSCQALNNLGQLVDDIWYYAGDKSTDFNWYSKRLLLAGIYKSTEIFMLQDKSEDFQNTWIFLDHRFDNVEFFGKNVKKCKKTTKAVGENLWGMFLMVQNILGVNSRVR